LDHLQRANHTRETVIVLQHIRLQFGKEPGKIQNVCKSFVTETVKPLEM